MNFMPKACVSFINWFKFSFVSKLIWFLHLKHDFIKLLINHWTRFSIDVWCWSVRIRLFQRDEKTRDEQWSYFNDVTLKDFTKLQIIGFSHIFLIRLFLIELRHREIQWLFFEIDLNFAYFVEVSKVTSLQFKTNFKKYWNWNFTFILLRVQIDKKLKNFETLTESYHKMIVL